VSEHQAGSTQRQHWLLASAAPFMTTLICWPLAGLLPSASLSLLYLACVLLIAVRTSTRPALWSALLSFLSYNFFFTEPRFTLFILHREDIITALVLMLVALLTGQLAASLREKVDALEASIRCLAGSTLRSAVRPTCRCSICMERWLNRRFSMCWKMQSVLHRPVSRSASMFPCTGMT